MSERRMSANVAKKKLNPVKTIGIAVVALAVVGVAIFFVMRGTPATDILFVEDSLEIMAGNTFQMDYVILPNNTTNKSVDWESSNSSVASVDKSGKIIGINEGEAIITITTSNGKIDECLVTVKPTAFDYLRKLGSSVDGYTIGSYLAPSDATISIGIIYRSAEDSLYLMSMTNGENPATIVIPSSLSGDYDGHLKWAYNNGTTVETLYSINASTLTQNTDIVSYNCDSNNPWGNYSRDAANNDAIYTSAVRTMLIKAYQEVLEPNGYTYADLGFNSYS